MFLLDFLISLSFIFEISALVLSFYFKNSKIFFLTLVLLGAKLLLLSFLLMKLSILV